MTWQVIAGKDHAFRIQLECIWKFGSKNAAFLTQPVFASAMIRVFPSFEHSTGVSAIRSLSAVCRTHSVDCQNVEETRNPMQKSDKKKCTHFFQRMFHLHFHQKSKSMIFCHIPYRIKKGQSASSDCPSFSFIGSIMFIPSLMHAWNLRSQ